MLSAIAVELNRRHAILISIVTFSQAPIMQYRDGCVAQSDFNCLKGASKIRGKDCLNAVIAASTSQLCSQASSFLREPARVPACRDPSLVIFGYGMCFKNNVDAHKEKFRTLLGDGSPELT